MDFVSWLEGELNTREWSQADLARKGNLTTAQVSRIMARQQNPGQVFIEGVSKAFDLPVAVVYQHAGLLPTNQRESTKVKVLLHIAEQLDEDDVEELIETARRAEVIHNNRPTSAYMGLVVCGVCGKTLRTKKLQKGVMWCCRQAAGHVQYPKDELMELVTAAIQDKIRQAQSGEVTASDSDNRIELYRKAIAKKQHERKQIQLGLLADPPAFTAAEAGKLVKDIQTEIDRLQSDIERVQQEQQSRRYASQTLMTITQYGDNFPLVFKHFPPEEINAVLRAWIRDIQIWNGGRIEVNLR